MILSFVESNYWRTKEFIGYQLYTPPAPFNTLIYPFSTYMSALKNVLFQLTIHIHKRTHNHTRTSELKEKYKYIAAIKDNSF